MALVVSHLHKQYHQRPVVVDVSFDVQPGEVVGLLGPNGAGKTTSFYAVSGVVRPDKGSITLDGTPLDALPVHERARLGLGYLPQETSVFRRLSVEDNLRMVLEFCPLSARERQARIDALLTEFGLTNIRNAMAIQLSGGERRRVEIARAIATNPKYLLLDEPFTGIDPLAIGDIHRLIRLLKERGLGILLTDHNPRATLAIVDRAAIMTDGRVIFAGPQHEVATNPLVKQYYLGEDFVL